MKKYWTIIKTEWQRQLTYRADFVGYRLGNLVEVFSQILIWSMIFKSSEMVRGYAYPEMITYIIIGWLFWYLTANFGLENKISYHIKDGTLSSFIIKPVSYIKYIVVLSTGRISIALLSGILVQSILIIFFFEHILFPDKIFPVLIILGMLFLGYIIRLFTSILIGFIAFWSQEIVGMHYFFGVLISLLSGRYFPIDLLPGSVVFVSSLFPFVYTFFIPTQIYLGRMSIQEGLRGLIIEFIWVVLLYVIIKIIWRKGLKKYESVGI